MPSGRSTWRRVGWFVLLWGASVAVTAAVAYLLRFWLVG